MPSWAPYLTTATVMVEDCFLEDWLDVLILEVGPGVLSRQFDATDWKEYFCVLEREPPTIRIFLDEQEYDDYRNFPATFGPTPRPRSTLIDYNRNDYTAHRYSSLGNLADDVSPSHVTVFRRRLSSGLGGLLSLTGLEKVKEETGLKFTKKKKGNQRKEKPKSTIFDSQFSGNFARQPNSATTTDSVDLTVDGAVDVRAIHPSIIGLQHCFVVSNSFETKFFSCRSGEEMSKWIVSVKKALDPSRDLECRTDISLSLWVVEARGLANKKRYFCDLLLDNVVYAKTSGKQQKTDTIFWGEQFVFEYLQQRFTPRLYINANEDLPELSMVQINVHKDYDKKKKKDKATLIGTVDIPTNSLLLGQEVETWYPVSLAAAASRLTEGASLRIRAKYQRNLILPLGIYNELLEFLKNNYSSLCHFLEPVLSAKAKDEIAKILVRILQACGKAKEFLIDIIVTEIERSADDNLLFRGNSFATKAMDYYMKMVGEEYLEQTLGAFVKSVYKFEEDCEVDPSRVPIHLLEANQENIKAFVQKAWNHIVCSADDFPRELVEVFDEVQNVHTYPSCKASCLKLISGTVFLRFLVPAILSPSLFGLAQEYPDEQTSRTLTLIAKVIQNLANGLKFDQSKEGYLEFMNDFINDERRSFPEFLKNISTKGSISETDYNGYVDLAKELSAMQNALNEQIDKLDKEALSQLSPLQFVLDSLNDTCQNPDAVGVFNPNSLILSKHTLSENLYKKLAMKTPLDAKLDYSKKPSALRNKLEYQDAELSDGREDATRNIIIKETKKRHQRYYDMKAGELSRDSSDRSSESPRSRRNAHSEATSTPEAHQHSGKRKPYSRKMERRNLAKEETRSPRPATKREFPTSDLGEDYQSSSEANASPMPPLQKLTVHYVNPSLSGKSSNSSGSKWTGSDYGSLPRNFERYREEAGLDGDFVDPRDRTYKRQDGRSEPRTSRRPISRWSRPLARSLEDIVDVQSDPESVRPPPRTSRPRSMAVNEAEMTNKLQNKALNVETAWGRGSQAGAPSSPILRRIDKFKGSSVSSSSSTGSTGLKTSSKETLEKETRAGSTGRKTPDLQQVNAHDNDPSVYQNTVQTSVTDISELRRELDETKLRLFEKQKELNEERTAMQKRHAEIEVRLRREQDLKDKELRSVYERLGIVEQRLRDQQTEMDGTLKAKNVIIQAQEQRIKSLNTDYNKLLEALNQLQKTPSVKNGNIRITNNL